MRQFGLRAPKKCFEVIERVFAARNVRPPTEAEQTDLDDCDDVRDGANRSQLKTFDLLTALLTG